MDKKIDNGRRECLKKSGLLLVSLIGASALKKLNATGLERIRASEADQQQRIKRMAVYVPKNCKNHKQVASKAKNPEQCNLCVDICPRKAVTLTDIKGSKLKAPLLDESKCIGCGRCLRVCPETPKGWEIWDQTNNKKLM